MSALYSANVSLLRLTGAFLLEYLLSYIAFLGFFAVNLYAFEIVPQASFIH